MYLLIVRYLVTRRHRLASRS